MNLMGIDEPDGSFQGAGLFAPGSDGVLGASIAGHALSRFGVDGRGSHRTDIQTSPTSDAAFGVGVDPAAAVADAGVHGTDIDAGRLVAGHADHRHMVGCLREMQDPDPGMGLASRPAVGDSTGHHTAHAAIAAFGIDLGDLHAVKPLFRPMSDRARVVPESLCRCCRFC